MDAQGPDIVVDIPEPTALKPRAKRHRARASSLDAGAFEDSFEEGRTYYHSAEDICSPIFQVRQNREKVSFHRSKTVTCIVKTPVALQKDETGIRTSIFVAAAVAARLMKARKASMAKGKWVNLKIAEEALSPSTTREDIEVEADEDTPLTRSSSRRGCETIWESLMDDDGIHLTIGDRDVFGGFVLDFMHRSWVKMNRSYFSNGLAACIKCITHSDDTVEATAENINYVKTKYPVYSDMVGLACDERLKWFIMEDVIGARQKQQCQNGVANSSSCRGLLKKRAGEIIAYKREFAILKTEVLNFVLQRKTASLRPHALDGPPMKEHLEDRHNRHQKFWTQFHAGSRKYDASQSWQATSPEATQLPRPSSSSPVKKQPRQCWKTRPARDSLPCVSRVQSGDTEAVHRSHIMQSSESMSDSRCSSAPCGEMRRPASRALTPSPCQSSDRSERRAGFDQFTNFQDILAAADQPKTSLDTKLKVPRHAVALIDDLSQFCCPKQLKAHKAASLPNLLANKSRPEGRRKNDDERPRSQASSRLQSQRNNDDERPRSQASSRLQSQRKCDDERPRSQASSRLQPQRSSLSEKSDSSTCEFAPPDAGKTFNMPWYSDGGVALWHVQTNPGKYLRSCHEQGVLPKPLSFMTGHSPKLEARGIGFNDDDLKAVSSMSMAMKISEVDLSENPSLSDSAIGGFLAHLLEEPQAVAALQTFNLKGCVQASGEAVNAILRLLVHPVSKLRLLDLSGITLSTKYHEPLFQDIQSHHHLRTVILADLGLKTAAASEVLKSQTLENLDLSWNCFSSDTFFAIGQRLAETGRLKSLSLSNCSSLLTAQDGGKQITPILSFIEQLAWDRKLEHLDLSMNRLDFRGTLVIEDALEFHPNLAELDVSRNPLGVSGMRSLLRLLSRDSSGLIHFSAEHCCIDSAPPEDHHNAGEGPFSMSNPAGRYSLNLAAPYPRTVLRMLLKICDRFKISPESSFVNIHYSIPPYPHPSKDGSGIWDVPTKGRFRAAFHLDCAMEQAFHGIGEDQFGLCLEKYFALTRMEPGFNKIVAFCAHWKSLQDHTQEQEIFLSAVSKDFMLTAAQITELSTSHGNSQYPNTMSTVHEALLSNICGGKMAQYLVMLETPSLSQYVHTVRQTHWLLSHNIDNPTGHYKLDLANPSCYAVAEQLVIIEQWEAGIAQRLDYPDTSERGNRSQFRNLLYMDRQLCTRMSEWTMADHGELEFDYVSIARPKKDAKELDKFSFTNILLVLGQAESTPEGQVQALKQTAHLIYLKCKQLREMLGMFSAASVRMDVFVALFLRIIDIWNEKVFRVRFEDFQEIACLQRRLGSATFFPFIQPEQYHFEYDFAYYDQRLAAHLMVLLNSKENKNEKNLKRYSFTLDDLPLGIPPSWRTFKKCPTEGVFQGDYGCAPEDRKINFRKEILQKYGYWKMEMDDTKDEKDEIMWWAGVSEAPKDCISYLEFLIPRYSSINHLYEVVSHGHGEINLREFEDSLKTMRCKKFAGPNESDRIKTIFRYLDPSGEGSVSKGEWGVLDLLWKEIIVSMEEFKQFLHRTFHGNLCLAWDFFDEDGSGEVDFDEWCSAIKRIRYFGPVEHTFHYIDLDDTGTIGWDEFQAMWERLDSRATMVVEG